MTAPAHRLDLRGLEPPEPLVRALRVAQALAAGEELLLITDRRPAHLLPLLVERGFLVATSAKPAGHQTSVRRP